MMNVKIVAGPGGSIPRAATAGAACHDVTASVALTIPPGGVVPVPTGLRMAVPEGWEMQVRSRSGLACKGIHVLNAPGTIDSDYRGEVMVILRNGSDSPFAVSPGDRIAQMCLREAPAFGFEVVTELDDTARGSGGFGSTGISSGPAEAPAPFPDAISDVSLIVPGAVIRHLKTGGEYRVLLVEAGIVPEGLTDDARFRLAGTGIVGVQTDRVALASDVWAVYEPLEPHVGEDLPVAWAREIAETARRFALVRPD